MPVRDQGASNQCVAYATSCLKEWEERHFGPYYFSPQFIYDHRQDSSQDNGMTVSDAFNIVRTYGDCYQSTYSKETDNITAAAREAKNFKFKTVSSLRSIDNVKASLANNGPCAVAFPCYSDSTEFWRGQGVADGGHCVAIVGYDDVAKRFLLRNSWGQGWGWGGYTYWPYDDWGAAWEIWTAVDGPSVDLHHKEEVNKCVCC